MKYFRPLLAFLGLFSALTVTAADSAFETAFRTSLLKSFDEATSKIISLADAIPESKYGWRPMEGVKSVREVLVHITETHYSLAERLGTKPPDGVNSQKIGAEMQTKAEAIARTKQSIKFMRDVLAEIRSEDLLPEADVFGAKAPKLRIALLPVDHAHEHLGQLIAYARINNVTPPWSK